MGDALRVQHGHLGTLFRQCPGAAGAGQSGANDDDRRCRTLAWLPDTADDTGQHFPLAAKARYALHDKAGVLQAAANKAGGAEGGQSGTGAAQSGQLSEQRRLPHVRIARRGKAVQKPGIHRVMQLPQHGAAVALQQGQADPATGKLTAMETGSGSWPLRQQIISQGCVWPASQGPGQIIAVQRVLLGGDKVQPRIRRGMVQKALTGAQKIQPGTKPGFTDAELCLCR